MAEMVRVDEATHARLRGLAEQTGESMASLLSKAVQEYEARAFWASCNAAYERLRQDPVAWAEEQAEREGWESINDGLDDEPPYPRTDDAHSQAR
jgi:predicted transcriptional regulator